MTPNRALCNVCLGKRDDIVSVAKGASRLLRVRRGAARGAPKQPNPADKEVGPVPRPPQLVQNTRL